MFVYVPPTRTVIGPELSPFHVGFYESQKVEGVQLVDDKKRPAFFRESGIPGLLETLIVEASKSHAAMNPCKPMKDGEQA